MNPEAVRPPSPRPASTLILLRDAAEGLEVLLLKRHGLSDVHGGAYVFPGGKLDLDDAELDPELHLDLPPGTLHASLAEPGIDSATAAGLFVAAVREAFEECGVLLAHGASADLAARATARAREGMGFNELVEEFGLRLHTAALAPWSRWITPVGTFQPKRFDTRFFVARLPQDVVARHDDRETIETAWVSPRTALERHWRREMPMAPPQLMTLAHLSRHVSVQSVLDEGRSRPPFTVQPEVLAGEGEERILCYPGDPAHPVPGRVMPGPSRLYLRDKRFEPEHGFDAFFR